MVFPVPWDEGMGWTAWTRPCCGTPWTAPWCPLSHGTKEWDGQHGQGHAVGHHGQPHGFHGPMGQRNGMDSLDKPMLHVGHHGQPHGVPGPMGRRDGMDNLDKAILGDTMDSPMVSSVPWDKGTGWTTWIRPYWETQWTAPWCPLSHGTKGRDGQLGQGHAVGHHGQPHGVPGPMGQRDGMDNLDKAILGDTMDSPMVSSVPWDKGTGWTTWTRPYWGTPWTAPWCPLSHGTKGRDGQLGQGHAVGHHGQPHGVPGPMGQRDGMDSLDKATGV